MLALDVSRAYFYAEATTKLFIEIPEEDWEDGDGDKVAMLNYSLYGTRAAAGNWEREYSSKLVSWGFVKGRASPCHFWHPERSIECSVHGDDFTAVAEGSHLTWLAEN